MTGLLNYRKPGSPALDDDELRIMRNLASGARPIGACGGSGSVVGRLTHRGLAERCPGDGIYRRKGICLTPLGRQLLARFED